MADMGIGEAAAILGGASLLGGFFAGRGAQQAGEQQAQATIAAAGTQERMLQEQLAATEPWRREGAKALSQLTAGFAPGGEFTKRFTLEDALNSPTEQAALQTSLEAMRNQMQLGGQNLSTNAITGAGDLAANIATDYENQAFNQWLAQRQSQIGGLQSLAGLGISGTGLGTQAMGQAGSNLASLQVGQGNALAAGTAGFYNAMGQGISGAANNMMQMYMLSNLLGRRPGSTSIFGGGSSGLGLNPDNGYGLGLKYP